MKIHDLETASNDRQSVSSDDRGEAMRTDLALARTVGAALEVMERDSRQLRGARPFVFTTLKTGQGPDTIVRFLGREGLML